MIETVYQLIQKLSQFKADTLVVLEPYGATVIDDMKGVTGVYSLKAEGEICAVIKIGQE